MLLYSYKLHHSDIQIVTPEGQNKYATSTRSQIGENERGGISNLVVEMPSD
jgi:hypothetical protein